MEITLCPDHGRYKGLNTPGLGYDCDACWRLYELLNPNEPDEQLFKSKDTKRQFRKSGSADKKVIRLFKETFKKFYPKHENPMLIRFQSFRNDVGMDVTLHCLGVITSDMILFPQVWKNADDVKMMLEAVHKIDIRILGRNFLWILEKLNPVKFKKELSESELEQEEFWNRMKDEYIDYFIVRRIKREDYTFASKKGEEKVVLKKMI